MSNKNINQISAFFFYRKLVKMDSDVPIVSFTFDDFPSSAICGAKLLKEYNKKGTFYVCCGLMNTNFANLDQFHQEDIEQLISDNHEIGCHSYHHSNAHKTTASDYENSLGINRQFMQEKYGVEMTSFAYPHGAVTPSVKKVCGTYYDSCRSVLSGINQETIDFNFLKANRLFSRSVSIDKCKTLIDMNTKRKGWLIFFTHDISNNPSEFGCSLDYLQQIIEYADKSSNILTIRDSINHIKSRTV